MKLKDLKTYQTHPTYEGRTGTYDPIPHYDLVKAVRAASSHDLKFATHVDDKTTSMVAVAVAGEDHLSTGTALVPAMLIMSSHTGRQSAEAVFGHVFRPTDRPPLFMVTCPDTVTRRHRGADGDLSKWAERVAVKYAAGHDGPGRRNINKWWDGKRKEVLTPANVLAMTAGFVGITSGRPSKTTPPLPQRTGALPVLEVMAADEDGLGMTAAGLLAAVGRVVDAAAPGLTGAYRKISLFRRLGDDTPPDVFGDD